MPVVRLEVDIDGDVYPELCAALSAIKNPVLREERLRQLAATGLVWEVVRVHGPPAMQLAALPARPPPAMPTAAAGEAAGERAASAVKTAARSASKAAAKKTSVRTDPLSTRSAEQERRAVAPNDAGSERHAPPSAAQLPVLVDIVATSPAEVPEPMSPDSEDAMSSRADNPPISAVSRGSGARARLMRMKDRGLFRNG